MVTATPMKRRVFYCAPKKPARVQPTLESLLDSLSSALNKMAGPISGGRKIQELLLESRDQVLGTLGRVSRGGHGTKPMAFSVAGDKLRPRASARRHTWQCRKCSSHEPQPSAGRGQVPEWDGEHGHDCECNCKLCCTKKGSRRDDHRFRVALVVAKLQGRARPWMKEEDRSNQEQAENLHLDTTWKERRSEGLLQSQAKTW